MGRSDHLEQIRAWEAGDLYPEHDTFSFGHGFGTALVKEHDRLLGFVIQKCLNCGAVTAPAGFEQVGWWCAGASGLNPVFEAMDNPCKNPLRRPVFAGAEENRMGEADGA